MISKDQLNQFSEAKELLALLLEDEGITVPRNDVIARRREGEAIPLSFTQQRLWFLNQLEPDSTFYNIPIAIRLKGSLDVQSLERALSELVRRHESLRTRFAVEAEQPVQVIVSDAKFSVAHIAAATEAEVTRFIEKEANQP